MAQVVRDRKVSLNCELVTLPGCGRSARYLPVLPWGFCRIHTGTRRETLEQILLNQREICVSTFSAGILMEAECLPNDHSLEPPLIAKLPVLLLHPLSR